MKKKHNHRGHRGTGASDTGEPPAQTAAVARKGNLAEVIRRRFAPLGGVELELPRRDAMRPAPTFCEESSPEKS